MARSRTTKQIAKRITLDYFKTPNPIRFANRVLIVALSLGALLYAVAYGTSKAGQKVYNPGPVSLAHASFQNDCRQCHDGGAGDPNQAGFNLAVSDAACLKCHDGPIHHSNQSTLVKTISDGGNAGANAAHLTSANCVACHVEHRGHEALAGVSSQHCTQCHEDLDAHSKDKAAIRIDKSVTLFASNNHPEFGRKLLSKEEPTKWVDPTPLAFNHAKHMDLFKNMESIQNCYGCHSAAGLNPNAKLPGPQDTETTSASPPWRTPQDRNPLWMRDKSSLAWTVSAEHEYIGPVNYERACIECHRLDSVPGMELPHESMQTVRQALAMYALSVEQAEKRFAKQLEDELAKNPNFLTTERVVTRPIRKVIKETKTKEQWLDEQMKPVLGNVAKWFEQDAAGKPNWPAKFQGAPVTSLLKDPEALQFYAAYAGANACAKCHTMTLEGGTGGATTAAATQAADANAPVRLATAPTGIGDTPRRWFVNSQFDHDAHRNQSCLECHHGANESKLTADVLMPRMNDCTRCHHEPSGNDRGAGSNCVTCHVYHDRTLERKQLLPTKTVAAGAPATQPAAQ